MRTFVGEMPQRIASLPRDRRGFPVPYFVSWIDGEPHFPVADTLKLHDAVKQRRCWICGEPLGAFKAFLVGPMCCVNRISAEPPSHSDCARFAALNCPFMASPLTKRTVGPGDQGIVPPGGIMIERNPGVCCVWVTKAFRIVSHGGLLFELGRPEHLAFFARSRPATRDEVEESVSTGLPILTRAARAEGRAAVRELVRAHVAFELLLEQVGWPEQKLPDVDLAELGFGEAVS